MFCRNCGSQVQEGAAFCPKCGSAVGNAAFSGAAAAGQQPQQQQPQPQQPQPQPQPQQNGAVQEPVIRQDAPQPSGGHEAAASNKIIPIVIIAASLIVALVAVIMAIVVLGSKGSKDDDSSRSGKERSGTTVTEEGLPAEEVLTSGSDPAVKESETVTTTTATTTAPATTTTTTTTTAATTTTTTTTATTTTTTTTTTTKQTTPAPAPADPSFPTDYGYIMDGYVNTQRSNLRMRRKPSTDAELVFDEGIPKGNKLEVWGTGYDSGKNLWYYCKYGAYEGWCLASYVSAEKPSDKPASKGIVEPEIYNEYPYHCHTVVDKLNLRTGPGKEYTSLGTIPINTELEEYGYSTSALQWIYVYYNGSYGWVMTYTETPQYKQYVEFEGGKAKPVIYLYPEEETEVRVKLELTNGELGTTYPAYGHGWDVLAQPDGSLTNLADGTHHEYLFWDSRSDSTHYDLSEGFSVRGEDTEAFLKEKLEYLGLNEKERNEFIVYWLPLMEHNRYNLISFQSESYTDSARLDITPKPDSLLRVFMVFKPLDAPADAAPQQLERFERRGFTVVEWGGTELR